MHGAIIDGDRWIARRLAFLKERLAGELSEAERAAVEAEIATLTKEAAMTPGGVRVPRTFRWLRRKVHRRAAGDQEKPST